LDKLPPGPLGFGYAIPAALGIILGAVYMLWMCQRMLFGPLQEPANTPDTKRGLSVDLTRREIGILAPIAALCLLLGVWPKPMLAEIESSVVANLVAPTGAPPEATLATIATSIEPHERR
jgi:NADH-quinone oxidoreductase subunit M